MNETFKSADQVAAERAGQSVFPCIVEVAEPGITWGPYTTTSSYVGGPAEWTYHRDQSAGRQGSPGGVDCTVRISPI